MGVALCLALPSACGGAVHPAGSAPNASVLITLLDAGAPRRASVYGHASPTTPFLEEFAQEGTLYTAASAAAPYTLASVASLFTGLSADAHGVLQAGDVLPEDTPTLAETFEAAGYLTFGLSSNAHIHKRFGFDRGFEPFEFHHARVGSTPHHMVPESLWSSLMEQLDRVSAAAEQPFFGYVHLMPPHAPYDPPEAYRRRFAPEESDARLGSMEHLTPLTVGLRRAGSEEAERIALLYDASLAYADAQLAMLEGELLSRRLTENLVWVVLSDHGEAFGEHGLFQHSGRVDEEMLRSLLLWRLPAGARGGPMGPGKRFERPVSTAALGASLLELTGVSALPARGADMRLDSFFDDSETEARVVARTAGPGPTTSLRRGDWKLVHYARSQRFELFDLANDPDELRDLASQEPDRVRSGREELDAYRREQRTRNAGQRVSLTPELREELEALGYSLDRPSSSASTGDAAAKPPR